MRAKGQLKWRIFYGDGSTFSNQDGPPELAPCRNVQVVAQMEDGKRRLYSGGLPYGVEIDGRFIDPKDIAYYWFDDGLWVAGDYVGFIDYMMEPGFKIVKFGRSIDTATFGELMSRADREFPLSE